jgi:preprotein translocase subunit Sec63
MAGRDLYAVLGIDAEADLPTIKRAYRRLVFSIHPDVGATPDRKRFLEIHEAYEILTDPERRRSGTRAQADQIYRGQMVVEPEHDLVAIVFGGMRVGIRKVNEACRLLCARPPQLRARTPGTRMAGL